MRQAPVRGRPTRAIEIQSLPEFFNDVLLALIGLFDVSRHLLDVGRMRAVHHQTCQNLLMSQILLPIRARFEIAHPLPFALFVP